MTKLADAIRRSQHVEAAPMGFGAAKPAAKPTIMVGTLGPSTAALDAAKAAEADVALIDARGSSLSKAEAEKAAAEASGVIIGAILDSVDATQAKDLKEAGIDFLVFNPDTTPAAALLDDDFGYVLALASEPEEAFLRSIEPLSLDSVFLEHMPSSLTVAAQLKISRINILSHKTLTFRVEPDVSPDELRSLRAVGVRLVLVSGEADAVRQVKDRVLDLPPAKTEKQDRPIISLPRGQANTDEEDDDDE